MGLTTSVRSQISSTRGSDARGFCRAAGFVGRVNIVSIAFAVLIIGLGVDFAIHLGMQYARLLCEGEDHSGAIHGAVQAVGASLVLCALSTAIGFLVFVPTDFRGVAELGLIAGVGMPILLLLTLTFFPALLTAWLPLSNRQKLGADLHFEAPWAVLVANHPRVVLLLACGAHRGSEPVWRDAIAERVTNRVTNRVAELTPECVTDSDCPDSRSIC